MPDQNLNVDIPSPHPENDLQQTLDILSTPNEVDRHSTSQLLPPESNQNQSNPSLAVREESSLVRVLSSSLRIPSPSKSPPHPTQQIKSESHTHEPLSPYHISFHPTARLTIVNYTHRLSDELKEIFISEESPITKRSFAHKILRVKFVLFVLTVVFLSLFFWKNTLDTIEGITHWIEENPWMGLLIVISLESALITLCVPSSFFIYGSGFIYYKNFVFLGLLIITTAVWIG